MIYDSPLLSVVGTETSSAAIFDAVKACTGLSARDLVLEFESLGDDCEFGALQRNCGAEPLGLFRWSNPAPAVILRGLETRFAGFGAKVTVELDLQKPRREWIVIDHENHLRQHTFLWEDDRIPDAFKEQQVERFHFCRRKIIEDLEDGTKIFVIKPGYGDISRQQVETIAGAMRKIGRASLLWVVPGEPAGRIQILKDGLFCGYTDSLIKRRPKGGRFSLVGWLAVLTGAWLLQRRLGADDASTSKPAASALR